MSFTVLYTADGQPWQVPSASVNEFLRKGYRQQNPIRRPEPALPAPIDPNPIASVGAARVNSDSVAKLVKAMPAIGTATAKAVIDGRPYTCIEDLIERVPLPVGAPDWLAYTSVISFE